MHCMFVIDDTFMKKRNQLYNRETSFSNKGISKLDGTECRAVSYVSRVVMG